MAKTRDEADATESETPREESPRKTAASVDEQWRAKIEACATRIETELGSQWMNEKGNEAARAAAKLVRELLA